MASYWVKSGTGGTDAGTSWTNAAESISGLITAQAVAGGDIIYVHNTHAHVAGAAISWVLPETGTGLVQILCVDGGDATGASLVDGTVGNLTTGAAESTNFNGAITIKTSASTNAALFIHGLTLTAGTGGADGAADFVLQATNGHSTYSSCRFVTNSTNGNADSEIGVTGTQMRISFINCTWKFGSVSQQLTVYTGRMIFLNCSIDSSGSSPTYLFAGQDRHADIECISCDWGAAGTTIDGSLEVGCCVFSNCVISTPYSGAYDYASGMVEFFACAAADGANGADILSYYFADSAGSVQDSQTVYKATSGAQGEQDDGTDTSYSLQMDPSTKCHPTLPLYTPWIHVLVGSTGSKTVALKVAHTEAAVLTDQDIFMEVTYMGEPGLAGTQRVANSPMSVTEVDDDCPIVTGSLARDIFAASAANRTDDALDDWTGITSEKEHTLTATVTCDEIGYIRCRVGLTKDTTSSVYVDPKISVT